MLGELIQLNLDNIAYVNDLELVKCEKQDWCIVMENEEEEIILDTLDDYEVMDDYNIRVGRTVINFANEIIGLR